MRGKKDDRVWEEFDKINDVVAKCKHCGAEFKGTPAARRLRNHLLGVPNSGIRICTQVPDHVKNALSNSNNRPQIEHHNSSNNAHANGDIQDGMQTASDEHAHERWVESLFAGFDQNFCLGDNLFSTSSPQLENHGDNGDEMQAVPQCTEQQASDERAHEQMVDNTSRRVYLVNNLPSTSAPQLHCEFQNGVQDGERMQVDQECFEGGGIRSRTPVSDPVNNTSSKRPRIEPPSSINNNEFNNHNRTIINEANISASTCAPQQNNNPLDHEGVQDQRRSAMLESSGDGEPLPTEKLVGATFKRYMDTVLEWLMSDEVSRIGIYGMGGVGKTTLLTHIYNRILEDKSKFGDVYWITVSQDFSIERVQNLIARSIHLDFGNEEDLKKRAAKLSKELRRKGKFVLIIDDLWNNFDVKKMGIPTEVNGCKLVVTTRSLKVCGWINCQEELKVEPFLKNEAWELFLQTLGRDLVPGVEQIARSIVGECAGLPLGIVTMAGSMRRVDDIHVWNNALTDLQKSKVGKDNMEDDVFTILRFSYAHLRESQLQECLLYCALYPEDFTISKGELIEQLIDEGIIERMDSRQEAFDKGYAMLNTLENSCLLECGRGYGVKMHDLIRDMAIQIMKECSPSLVEAGKQLTCLPNKNWWTENIVRVSLMENDIKEISSDHSPRCPNLSTLILSNNRRMQSIAEPFFYQLHGLKVLDLSDTRINKLPESVGDLEKLTALILRNCEYLMSLPSLRKLEVLEKLDLYACERFEKVPEGLESLFNLNYLDLLYTGVKDLPAGILTNLSHLQHLTFYNSSSQNVKGEEVGRLRNLETLYWGFNDQEDFNNYMHTEKQQLSQFKLFVGSVLYITWSKNELYFVECNISREVLLRKDVQHLDILNVTIHNGRSLCLKNVINLKEFHIDRCEEMEYLFCLSSSPSIFQTLEKLHVCNMENLRGLFSKDEDDGVIPPTPIPIQLLPTDTFSCLKKFIIEDCHSMKKLFPCALLSNLQNLELLAVLRCSKLEEIIATEEEEGSNSHSIFTHALPNLRELSLVVLPKLKRICNAKLKCDFLKLVNIHDCPELKEDMSLFRKSHQ